MIRFIWWRGEDQDNVIHIRKSSVETQCGQVGSFWEDVPDSILQKTAKHCTKCHQKIAQEEKE